MRAQKEKIIHLEVTDNEDSFFLFFLDVGESDFHTLKREQAILIDFPVFAEHLIELVIACGGKRDTSENVSSLLSSSSAMNKMPSSCHAKLDTAEERFSIFESNAFKQITHISLKVNDSRSCLSLLNLKTLLL